MSQASQTASQRQNDREKNARIRKEYRTMIEYAKENRDQFQKPGSKEIKGVLEDSNKLFEEIKRPREAALYSKLLKNCI